MLRLTILFCVIYNYPVTQTGAERMQTQFAVDADPKAALEALEMVKALVARMERAEALVGAAPDMLAALKIALEALDYDLTADSVADLRKLFRTAIDMAGGK